MEFIDQIISNATIPWCSTNDTPTGSLKDLIHEHHNIHLEHSFEDNKRIMLECFKSGLCCDVELIGAENSRLSAHKLVLMAGSDFFLQEFKNPHVKKELKVNHLNAEALNALVTFCYTGKLEICGENVVNILSTAKFLQMKNVTEKCILLLQKSTNVETCSIVLTLAQDLDIPSLRKWAFDYACENFSHVSATNTFRMLKEQDLYELLNFRGLVVQNENFIYEVVKKWIFQNRSGEETSAKLLNRINIWRLSLKCVKDLYLNFKNIVDGSEIMKQNLMKCLGRQTTFEQMTSNNDFPQREYLDDKVVVVGGSEGIEERFIEMFDLKLGTWSEFMDISQHVNKNFFSAVPIINETLNSEILIVGGCSDIALSTTEIVDLTTRTVTVKSPLHTPRYHLGAALIQDKGNIVVYAIGGRSSGGTLTKTCEMWDTKSWFPINDMVHARAQFGVAVLEDKVYVAGGAAEINGKEVISNSVEMLNLKNLKWEPVASMQVARYSFTLVAVQNHLFAIGGASNEYKAMAGVEKYNPITNSWTSFVDLPCPMYGLAGCRFYDTILVCGGGDDPRTQKTVHEYNFQSGKWKTWLPNLVKERFGANIFLMPYIPKDL